MDNPQILIPENELIGASTNSQNLTVCRSTSCSFDSAGTVLHGKENQPKGDEYLDSFPPGYRFRPSDYELIVHYLKNKILDEKLPPNKIRDVELYKYNPEFLSENYKSVEKDWYFFTPRDRKYKNGARPNRAAGDGYWKATGRDKLIQKGGHKVGFRKALVFYTGKPPKGTKTDWIMHEYRLDNPPPRKIGNDVMRLDDWVLCRIYKKVDKSSKAPSQIRDNEVDQTQSTVHIQSPNINSDTTQIMMPNYGSDQQIGYMSTIDNHPCLSYGVPNSASLGSLPMLEEVPMYNDHDMINPNFEQKVPLIQTPQVQDHHMMMNHDGHEEHQPHYGLGEYNILSSSRICSIDYFSTLYKVDNWDDCTLQLYYDNSGNPPDAGSDT